ncbi:hypothetical protein ACFWXK_14990 [Streptomyces sp. NPDC059070]|uniref:hypothetical protein n=1 Tax=Streptomyces sp. NPDC059070 TaxID=3346713 RepID=UPI003689FF46
MYGGTTVTGTSTGSMTDRFEREMQRRREEQPSALSLGPLWRRWRDARKGRAS